MTNNDTATITLNNNHGTYTADVDMVGLALIKTAGRPLPDLRREVAGCCGYDEGDVDALRDCTWLELCIIWIESGNFVL